MYDGDLMYGDEFVLIGDGIGGNRWNFDEGMKRPKPENSGIRVYPIDRPRTS